MSDSKGARYWSSTSSDSAGLVKQAHRYLEAINSSLQQPGDATTIVDSPSKTPATLRSSGGTPVLPNVRMLEGAIRGDVVADMNATPLQIWEGRVTSVDWEHNSMDAILSAKIGSVPDHVGQIDLQWVSEQDLDLVQPGAIFYLTLYKRVTRGSVQNSQELRFRRIPNWTRRQIDIVEANTLRLMSKVKMGPRAE